MTAGSSQRCAFGWIVALTACWVAIQAFKETHLPTDSGDSYRVFGVYLEFLAPLSALVGMFLSRQRGLLRATSQTRGRRSNHG